MTHAGDRQVKILVLNCGSSSLKYRLIQVPEELELASGEAQRVGPRTAEPSRLVHRVEGVTRTIEVAMRSHREAFERAVEIMARDGCGAPDAIAHRIVHGGPVFRSPAVLDEAAMAKLKPLDHLAPIHNPPATALVEACLALYPDLPQVAVFDTAFHASIPEYAREYAIDRGLAGELGIRKYGFHGTSHAYVAQEAARFLGIERNALNAVSCHLGSGGASLCAIRQGRSVDNTMGFSPLQGLVMSTRCGDLDPAVTLQLLARAQGNGGDVEKVLNRQSGVLGLSQTSADIRDVLAAGGAKSAIMSEAAQVYLWRIRKYLGAYLAVVGKTDAIIFTDTIGESVPEVRLAACGGMEFFGVKIDPCRNEAATQLPCDVACADSPVRVLVIATNEELAIARAAFETLETAARAA